MINTIFCVMAAAALAVPSAARMSAWFVSSSATVSRGDKPAKMRTMELPAARNATAACQVVLLSAEAIEGVRVSVSELRSAEARLKPCLSRVGYAPAKCAAREGLDESAIQIDLDAKSAQPLCVWVSVPEDAAPGVYRGTVAITDGGKSTELPLSVNVGRLAIPGGSSREVALHKRYETVTYELLKPQEVKALKDKCPIAYVPFGATEWHSYHQPLGTDSLKAYAVCCECALRHGGISLAPRFGGLWAWGAPGWEGYTLTYNDKQMLFEGARGTALALASAGWKVIVFVTGHDVEFQRNTLQEALDAGIKGTGAVGFAIEEGELHDNPDPDRLMAQITEESWPKLQARIEKVDPDLPFMMDHAATWETSCMLYAYPDQVDLDELRKRNMCATEMTYQTRGPEGILGKSPLKYASPELGKKIIEKCADLISAKAQAMLK